MKDDFLHVSDGRKSVSVSVNYCWSHKEVTEVTEFSEEVIILNLNVHLLRFMFSMLVFLLFLFMYLLIFLFSSFFFLLV